jgi:hypothetical protein
MSRFRDLALRTSAALAFIAVLAATAAAAEVSRAEYRAAAEPICKVDTQANERILAGVKSEVRHGKLKPAAVKFSRAAAALKRAEGELKALPQPAADQSRLAKWFGYVDKEVRYFEAAAANLRAGKKGPAESYVTKLSTTANLANSTVLPFEFEYCRLEPSRFT